MARFIELFVRGPVLAMVVSLVILMLGLRSSFRLEVTRVAGTSFEKLQVWVRAFLRADVQLARPEAFDIIDNIG